MSTGYSWEGIRQVRATLLGARHVPECLCGGYVYLGRYIKCSTFTFTFTTVLRYRAACDWGLVVLILCISFCVYIIVCGCVYLVVFVVFFLFCSISFSTLILLVGSFDR